ncbi:MAG: YfhO family protein [Clostridia bacterium]|nr:YfhO family protein [Clostridia bacterium]
MTAPQLKNEKGKTVFSRAVWRLVNGRSFYLIGAFFLPLCIMWVIFMIKGVYPITEKSVLVLDLNGQYVYFFEAMRDIFQGNGSPFYTWFRSLGGEFSGIYAYYVASPFALLSVFFPENGITEFLLWSTLLKVGASGLTFGIYLHNSRPSKPINVVIFSTCYALTSYAVVQAHNTMWIDSLIYLPLICLGIENIVRRGRASMYCLTLALCFISNFYIGWMTAIFSTLYFFYYYLSKYPFKDFEKFFYAFYKWLIYSIVAAMIASVILLPTYFSLQFGKNTFQNPSYAFEARFDFIKLFTQMLPNSYDTVRPNGLPFIYCGLICLTLLPVYFISKNVKGREKIMSGIILAMMVLSFTGSTIDLFWHGLQKPNWLNYRYSYMFCFLVIVFAYEAFRCLDAKLYRAVLGCGGVIGVLIVIVQALPDADFTIKRASDKEFTFIQTFYTIWFSIIMLGILLAVLWAAAHKKRGATGAVLAVVCLELMLNGIYDVFRLHEDVYYSTRESYVTFMERWSGITRSVQESDSSLYRMEKIKHRKVNDNMTLRIRGISNSTSTLNASSIRLLFKMGYASKSHWSRYVGGNVVNDSLIGIKYVLDQDKDKLPPEYELYLSEMDPTKLYEDVSDEEYDPDKNMLYAYINNYALPVMFGVSSDIQDYDIESEFSAPDVLNSMISAMLGREVQIYEPLVVGDSGFDSEGLTQSSVSKNHRKWANSKSGSNGTLTITFNVEKDGSVYFQLPSEYPRDTLCRVQATHEDGETEPKRSFNYLTNETHTLYYLGEFKAGDEVKLEVCIRDSAGNLYYYKDTGYVYYFNLDTFKEVYGELTASLPQITSFSDTKINAVVNMAEGDTMMYTSIPFDKGWTVKVDGKRVKLNADVTEDDGETPYKANNKVFGALLAFEVPEGEHTIEMSYTPQGFRIGAVLAVAGLTILIFGIVKNIRKDNKRRRAKLAAYRAAYASPTPAPAPELCEDPPEESEAVTPDTPEEPDREPAHEEEREAPPEEQ